MQPRGNSGLLLSVGSGPEEMPEWKDSGYTVVRLDVDPSTRPDIVASMTDMGPIGPYDVVFCCHALEHVYPHEVPVALAEFHRVLRPGGSVVILVPDLQDVPPTADPLPGMGGYCGLHLYYGDAAQIAEHPSMAHHCGFVAATLHDAMEAAGFKVRTKRLGHYQLIGIGVRN